MILVTYNELICPLGDRVIRLSDGLILEDYTQDSKSAANLHW